MNDLYPATLPGVLGPDLARALKALRRLLPADAMRTSPSECAVYECDGLPLFRRRPPVVLLPGHAEEVATILRVCADEGVPLVPRGAGTGLSGGALPCADGFLLSLARMNRVRSIDPVLCRAVVEPGVRNLAVSEAAARHGLFYAPDPSSQIACSIGGNIAENAGGIHCLKYGLTVHNVVSVDWIDAGGERFTAGGAGLDGPGLDVLAALTGSEGLLGVVVEATLRLLPRPEAAVAVLAAFSEVGAAAQAVSAIIAGGITPAGLEMMDRAAIRAVESHLAAGYPADAAAVVVMELDGAPGAVEEELLAVERLCRPFSPLHWQVARDAQTRARLWAGRKGAFAAVGSLAPDYYCMDGTIPRGALAKTLERIESLAQAHDLPVANVFHAGDGNLHPLILFDAGKPDELERALTLGREILKACIEAGGSITGEHGVGIEKIDEMCDQFSPSALARFHALKRAFDPRGLLNPGKAIPTLARCAEFGAMHVHQGKLAFPWLERY